MRKLKFKRDFIALGVSLLLCVLTLVVTRFSLSISEIVGMSLCFVSLIFYLFNKRTYVITFLLTLVLASVCLINLSFIGINLRIFININPLYIVLIVIFFLTNKESLTVLFPLKEKSEENQESENIKFEKNVLRYELKFKDKNESSLKYIAKPESAYLPEAKEAASRILQNKASSE